MDYEEATKISGKDDFDKIISFYKPNGTCAMIIINGSEPTYVYSSG